MFPVPAPIRWLLRLLSWGLAGAALILGVRAVDSRRLPELHPWHRDPLRAELRGEALERTQSVAEYLAAEERVRAWVDLDGGTP